MKSLRLLAIALCLTATGAAHAGEASEKARDAVEEMRKHPPESQDVDIGYRAWCDQPGYRDLTVAECKREIAWMTRTLKNATPTSNLGTRVFACSEYCEARYPSLA